MEKIERENGLQRGYLVFFTLIVTCLVFYGSTIMTIAGEWMESGSYNHGFLALAIAAAILWGRRSCLTALSPVNEWLAMVLLAGSTIIWWLATAVNIQVLQVFAFFALFAAAFGTLYGRQIVIPLALPLTVLFLVIPIWDFLQAPLQTISSDVSEVVLRLIGIPLFRDGYVFSVPSGRFVVEEGCSGLGFLLCSVLLAILYNHMNRVKGWGQVWTVAISIGFAMVSNWIRIILIMLVGNYTNMQHPVVDNHLTFGWFLFAALLVPYYFMMYSLFPGSDEPGPVCAKVSPNKDFGTVSVLTFPVIAFFPVMLWMTPPADLGEKRDIVVETITEAYPPRRGLESRWEPQYPGASFIDIYRSESRTEQTHILLVRYDYQLQGEELVYIGNRLFNSNRWSEREVIKTGNYALVRLRSAGATRDVVYWYFLADEVTADPLMAKWLELMSFIKGDRRAYLIALASDNPQGSLEESPLIGVAIELQDRLLARSVVD